MGVTGTEGLAMAANVFVGQTEAPLTIKPMLERMTRAQLMTLMVGGFATVAGSVLAAYVGFLGRGDPAEAAMYPWAETRDAPLDVSLQAGLLAAFCQANEAHRGAYYVWNWFGPGGPRDGGYSLRGKPAAAVFEECMARGEG